MRLSLKKLSWDTKFFGRPSFILIVDQLGEKDRIIVDRRLKRRQKKSFITAKIPSLYGTHIIGTLQDLGFKYIDTEVILKSGYVSPSCNRNKAGKFRVYELKNNVGLPYEELGASFDKTRFHKDPNILREVADRLWVSYIKNYKITPARRIFVAKAGRDIAGAILVNKSSNGREAVLSFVAVLDKYRGTGVGSRLIGYVQKRFEDLKLLTETQASNKRALNFYIKNGFCEVEGMKTILHRW